MRYTADKVGVLLLSEVEVLHSDGSAIPSLLRVSDKMWSELQSLPFAKALSAPRGQRVKAFYALLARASARWGLGDNAYLSGYASPSEGGFVVLYFRSLPQLGEVTLRAVYRSRGAKKASVYPLAWRFRPLRALAASECP